MIQTVLFKKLLSLPSGRKQEENREVRPWLPWSRREWRMAWDWKENGEGEKYSRKQKWWHSLEVVEKRNRAIQ